MAFASPALHQLHDGRIDPETGAEGEPPSVRDPEAHPPAPPRPQCLHQLPGRLHRRDRDAQGPGEHVGAPARDDADRGKLRVGPAGHEPVDDLVHGAVAAEGYDRVVLAGDRGGAEFHRVAAGAGLRDVELENVP